MVLVNAMSTGAYAPDKALAFPKQLKAIKEGWQPYPIHLHLIISDLCNLDCPGCFPSGTMVLTADGYEPIERLEEGQRVFAHDGKLHAISGTSVHQHGEDLLYIRPRKLGSAIRATSVHPFYTKRGWIKAADLRAGDFVALRALDIPETKEIKFSEILDGISVENGRARAYKGKTTCPDRVPLNASFGEFLGMYLGDGHVGRCADRPSSFHTTISFGSHEESHALRAQSLIKELFDLDASIRQHDRVIDTDINSSLIGRLVIELCRRGSHEKQFHPALLGASKEFLEGLMRGYAMADGCLDDRSFSTASRPLALLVYQLALKLGMSPTLFEQPGRPSMIKGRAIHAIGPKYTIRLRGYDRAIYDRIVGQVGVEPNSWTSRNWHPTEFDGQFYWLEISQIERRAYRGPVYNIEVEDAASYIADGLVVHNCSYRLSGYSSNQLFSGTHGERNPNRMLEPDLVYRILDDCAAMGVRAVEFTGGGDPTVHPDCAAFLTYARELGLKTALITNGIKMSDALLAEAVLTQWTRISLDAATALTYGTVRPNLAGSEGGNFARACQTIKTIAQSKRSCLLGVGFVVQRDNWKEIYDASRMAYLLGADNIRISGLFTPEKDAYHADYRTDALELEKRAIADFDHKGGAFRVHGRFGEKLSDLSAPPDYRECHYEQLTTYIGGDGNLYRCCVTSYNLHGLIGSVREMGFKGLWDSKLKFDKFAHFDARTCSQCQFNDRNRAIERALRNGFDPLDPASIVHPDFV